MDGYTGDITSTEAWVELQRNPEAVLVDVRTRAEWTFVGVPVLAELGKQVVCIEWTDMYGHHNSGFLDQLAAAGIGPESTVLFLCRSGARSAAAAALAAPRVAAAYNVADGFEGPLDDDHHRGTVAGWKNSGLAWAQG